MADKKEPPFQLKIEPDEKIVFKGKAGEALSVDRKITNNTDDRQAFKVKCTANEIFRVRTPLGFIEPKESVTIKITFTGKGNGENNKHFFAFYHIKSDKKAEADKTPRQVWHADAKPLGVARQFCVFEIEGGEKKEEEKKEEKKEEEKKEEKKEEEKK